MVIMNKNILLSKSNLKTSKGASICVGVLLFIAALLFNLALVLVTDYKDNFYRLHDKLNAESVSIMTVTKDNNYESYIDNLLSNDDKVDEYEYIEAYGLEVKLPFNSDNFISSAVIVDYNTAANKSIGKMDIVGKTLSEEGIYLPYLFKRNGYELGDNVKINFGTSNEYEFKVVGFFNSIMVGSNNCAMTMFCLSDNAYNMIEENMENYKGYFLSIRLKDQSKSQTYEGYITDKISADLNTNVIYGNNFNVVSMSRYITQMIASIIILILASLIVVIAIFISAANLSEYIKQNMKKIGALKALGYTSKDLILSFLFQFGIIAFASSLVGASSSYLLMPIMNNILLSQTGIPYSIHFIIFPFGITVLILVLAILLTILLSSIKVRNIDAIVALRNGIMTHSFKRNVLPLENTKKSLNIRLGLKTAINNVRGNITTIITTFVLAFVTVFNVFLLHNAVITFDPMIKLICSITPDGIIIFEDNDDENSFINEISSDKRVYKYYLCSESSVSCMDEVLKSRIVGNGKDIEEDLIIKGRAPLYNNEVGIGAKFAIDNKLEIGDTISISIDGVSLDFIISGFTQNSDNLGKDCVFTREAFKAFGSEFSVCYYIYVNDDASVDDVLDDYMNMFSCTGINYMKTISAFTEVYRNLILMIFIGIFVISILVIAFVLFLLVRSLIEKKQREFGILKALGYKTSDLMIELIISFVPALIIGSLLGVVLGYFFINPLFGFFMSGLGLIECNLYIPFGSALLGGLLIVLISVGIIYLLSIKIKKIEAYNLLTAE